MPEKRVFQLAVVASILIHSICLLGLPYLPALYKRKDIEKLEINYYKEPKRLQIQAKKRHPAPGATTRVNPVLKKLPQIKKEEILKPPTPASEKKKASAPRKTRNALREEAREKTFEKVIQEERSDTKKATYISYYRAVREKIRKEADEAYTAYRRLTEGEVFLSFVVASSGELLRVRIIDKKSVNDSILRNIAINSIRDASPFPPFPEGIEQPRITFNIIISFEAGTY